ncbi:MAG: helicase-related protein, partial [Acidimicrobiales bacterium]
GESQLLCSTTVIEVGVDVPNATLMMIEDADRFGLAQLHQLRGRVGRSTRPSWCFLLGRAPTPDGEARLDALVNSADGFELAEIDLELRGEGTLLGSAQSGASDLRLANLRRDADLLDHARVAAERLVAEDPLLRDHRDLVDEIRLFLDPAEEAFLFKS